MTLADSIAAGDADVPRNTTGRCPRRSSAEQRPPIVIWGRLYREIRSTFTLGSIDFTGFLLAENVIALWYYLSAPTATPAPLTVPLVVEVMMLLRILEVFGTATLLYNIWQ